MRKTFDLEQDAAQRDERLLAQLIAQHGMYPLNAPGMPPPGPDFLRVATTLAGGPHDPDAVATELARLYREALREPGFRLAVETRLGQEPKDVVFVPGHIWGQHFSQFKLALASPEMEIPRVDGPHPAEVMVIGKMPWKEETDFGRNFVDASGEVLISTCAKLHIGGLSSWYVTNLLKFMPPDGSTNLRVGWVADCLPLLFQELRLVRPKYILFLGADASKWVLGSAYLSTTAATGGRIDKSVFGVGAMAGRVVEIAFPLQPSAESEPRLHRCQCMTVLHPAQVAREPVSARTLESGLGRFSLLLSGRANMSDEEGLDHRICTSYEEAVAWTKEAAEALAEEPRRLQILGVDAEWEGQHAVSKNAWLATVQISWGERQAICFHLRDEQGEIVFRDADGEPAIARLAALLTEFVNGYRVAGHFFVSDLEMLLHEGFDFRAGYFVPFAAAEDGTPAWQRCLAGEGGLDTAMMVHAVEETAQLGLEHLTMRYTTAPRYDVAMEDAVIALCKSLNIKRAALEGYGKVPRGTLIPYALFDADVTRRIAVAVLDKLDCDYEGNCCWEPFWESMIVQPVILEMHQTGIVVDRRRVDEFTLKFMEARRRVDEQIKQDANWPTFNVRSIQQVKEYLFGTELNGKVSLTGQPVRLRPPDAFSLQIEPLLTTDKPPKRWADVVREGRVHDHSPTTGKQVLAMLAQDNPQVADEINRLRDYRFLDQALKSVLRPPLADDDGNWLYEDDMPGDAGNDEGTGAPGMPGLMLYDAGLAGCIDPDGRVRTHMYPTTETGRFRHSRPNLANLSKQRDKDYARLLGKENYKNKLRSVLMVPEGYVGVEFDLRSAELHKTAIMADDPLLLEHVERGMKWPDSGYDLAGKRCACGPDGAPLAKCEKHPYPHPECYDIHSSIAVAAFRLTCHPSKAGLKSIDRENLRVVAKCVVEGSRLHTSGGWLRVDDLAGHLPADTGAVYRGKLTVVNDVGHTPIVGVYNGGQKPCLRVTTEDGYQLESTYTHRYLAVGEQGELIFKKGGELQLGDWVCVRDAVGPFGNDTRFPRFECEERTCFKDVSFPERFDEDWAALLGLYLAEGSANAQTGAFQVGLASEQDPEFADKTRDLLGRLFGERVHEKLKAYADYQDQVSFRLHSVKLTRWLTAHCGGNSRDKFIPEFVFRWPQSLIASLLRWLFEGDGTVRENAGNFTVAYCTASKKLATDLRTLLLTFGITTVTTAEKRRGYGGTYYTLRLTSNRSRQRFVDMIGFLGQAKKARCVITTAYSRDTNNIPGQTSGLRKIMPLLTGEGLEKCRECVRESSPVRLNRTRLQTILAAVVPQRLHEADWKTAAIFAGLKELTKADISFQRVTKIEDIGSRQVYDVQTTDERRHLVSYNGLLTHQTVIFGIFYGRGAKAIAMELRSQGIFVTVDEAQSIIDTVFKSYRKLDAFFAAARARVANEHWLCNWAGRLRRFPAAADFKMQGEFERQAMNYTIQSGVASFVDRLAATLHHARADVEASDWFQEQRQAPDERLFHWLLQIHDALVVMARPWHVNYLCEELIPWSLQQVPVYPTTLDGMPIEGRGPYYLGVETELFEHWSEPLSTARRQELGLAV